eukprot:CAMPEP_0177668718 /NCGR_PEP_ID=MMETSP0447-20121125/22956_1 /TAXON_ID=0 /ORGANISM="Stygamoeba regulata, Strain BSH-02190019" /LENGTH=156 /DNA_ID=CAMNT_0019175335 /DNA_START=126 /DNA_END=592 /DNA_ORIENTATION=+
MLSSEDQIRQKFSRAIQGLLEKVDLPVRQCYALLSAIARTRNVTVPPLLVDSQRPYMMQLLEKAGCVDSAARTLDQAVFAGMRLSAPVGQPRQPVLLYDSATARDRSVSEEMRVKMDKIILAFLQGIRNPLMNLEASVQNMQSKVGVPDSPEEHGA